MTDKTRELIANDHRQEIYSAISEMLDDPDKCGIYPTTRCYDRLEAYCKRYSDALEKLLADNERLHKDFWTQNDCIANLHTERAKLQAENERLEAARKNWYCENCGCGYCLDAEDALAAVEKDDD